MNKVELSAIDRKILNCIQEDIPLRPEPFKILSKKIKIEEKKLLDRIRLLKDRGVICRFAAGINHRKLGFRSTLLGMKVSMDKLDAIVKEIVVYPEVTHCYLREGEYNLWIVFICPEKGELDSFLNILAKRIGRRNILNLRTKRQFKLKTVL